MAYTIQFNNPNLMNGYHQREKVLAYLQARMIKEGIFRATLTPLSDSHGRSCIKIRPVRLVKAKPYCGNHPGECQVNPILGPRKKPMATYLEWDDWVKFHNLVNRVLNRFKVNADVWSTPQDVRGKMWIRRGIKARIRWDWTERFDNYGRVIRDWNQGTPDQF